MPVGVTVQATEVPPTSNNTWNITNQLVVGFTDWGPVGQPIACTTLANAASQLGTPAGGNSPYAHRTATCATVLDAIETSLAEDGAAAPVVYVSRVVHASAVSASLTLAPSAAVTLTAQYPGVGGNGIYVAVTAGTGSDVVITLTDAAGNTLAQSGNLATLPDIVAWAATTGLVTATTTGASMPSVASATALSGGTDNRSSATLADWQAALAAVPATLGPMIVSAPGETNTVLPGIWNALGVHAQNNNRVALLDCDDDTLAATIVTDMSGLGSSAVSQYTGAWAGNRNIPGVTINTSRSVPPSAAIAGLIARAYAATGNPNRAAAGVNYPLAFATAPTSLVSGGPVDTYSLADLQTLNGAGVNTFQNVNGVPTNYGFVSVELESADTIFWQLNHAITRMYIVAQAQLTGQTLMFEQIDGQGSLQNQFKGKLNALLQGLWTDGALFGETAQDAFTVDVGSDVNTPATIAQGQLNAVMTCSFSYFAQNVRILVNVVPITQTV